jgi:hypothetical protein
MKDGCLFSQKRQRFVHRASHSCIGQLLARGPLIGHGELSGLLLQLQKPSFWLNRYRN